MDLGSQPRVASGRAACTSSTRTWGGPKDPALLTCVPIGSAHGAEGGKLWREASAAGSGRGQPGKAGQLAGKTSDAPQLVQGAD